jgi:hypothetical protein
MPIATANLGATERKDLKTLEGAFVVLRRMTYGQVVERRAMTKLSVTANSRDKRSIQGEMAMANKEVARYEFKHCVVDHNLEKDLGNDQTAKLDFNSSVDFDSLDPRVGQEIEKYIGEMNNFEDDDQEN